MAGYEDGTQENQFEATTVAKWAHFYFKSMMQYSSHCLFHHITPVLFYHSAKGYRMKVQLRSSPIYWLFVNPPTIIIPQGVSQPAIRVHTICAGQGWPLLSRKFTSPASRSGYRRPSHQEKPCQTSKPFIKTGFS